MDTIVTSNTLNAAMASLIREAMAPGGIGEHEFTRPGGWRDRAKGVMSEVDHESASKPGVVVVPFNDAGQATAAAIRLATQGASFQFKVISDSQFEIVLDAQNASKLEGISAAYLVVQEGGSSMERYIHSLESRSDAEEDRASCGRDGAYRTGPVVEIPAALAELGEVFYEAAEALLNSLNELEVVTDSPDDVDSGDENE